MNSSIWKFLLSERPSDNDNTQKAKAVYGAVLVCYNGILIDEATEGMRKQAVLLYCISKIYPPNLADEYMSAS